MEPTPLINIISPYIRIAHDYTTGYNINMEARQIIDHALHYFKAGEGTYTVNNVDYPVYTGALFLIRPTDVFSIKSQPETRFHMLNLHFDVTEQPDSKSFDWPYHPFRPIPVCIPYENLESAPGLPSCIALVETNSYEQLFFRILQRFGQPGIVPLLESKAIFIELLALLWRQIDFIRQTSGDHEMNRNLDVAVQYIRSHLKEPIALEQVAKAAQMSKSYLLKCFRRVYNCTPMKFWTLQRIELAKWDLLYSDKPIKSIASEIGYDGLHSFYHAFRREVGMPPAEYRLSNTHQSDVVEIFNDKLASDEFRANV